jgi:hypothetical protein
MSIDDYLNDYYSYPHIGDFLGAAVSSTARSAKGRVGAYTAQKNRLQRQFPLDMRKIAEIDRKIENARKELDKTKPVDRTKLECNLWEFTKYYKYVASGKSKNSREFEVKVAVHFPTDWDSNDVKGYWNRVSALCDEALQAAFPKAGYDSETYNDIYNEDFGHPLANSLTRGWAVGAENQGSIGKLNATISHTLEAEVDDKTAHYWKGTIKVDVTWRIPEK